MNEKLIGDLNYLIEVIEKRYKDFDISNILSFSIGFLKDYPELVKFLEFIEDRSV